MTATPQFLTTGSLFQKVIVEDRAIKLINDVVDTTTQYIGKAEAGSGTGAPVWQIQRILTEGTTTTIEWADGDYKFDNVWDDRASKTYS